VRTLSRPGAAPAPLTPGGSSGPCATAIAVTKEPIPIKERSAGMVTAAHTALRRCLSGTSGRLVGPKVPLANGRHR
jgi:hypothetical protein